MIASNRGQYCTHGRTASNCPREREQDVLGPDQSDKLGAEARPMRRARRVNKLAHEPFAGGLIAETARPRRGGAETVRWSIDVETALDTSPGTPRRPADCPGARCRNYPFRQSRSRCRIVAVTGRLVNRSLRRAGSSRMPSLARRDQIAVCPGGVASSSESSTARVRAPTRGSSRNASTSSCGPPRHDQSSSQRVESSHERSAGNIRSGKIPFQ